MQHGGSISSITSNLDAKKALETISLTSESDDVIYVIIVDLEPSCSEIMNKDDWT